MFVPAEYQQRRLWRRKYPAIPGALLSVFQLVLTMAIVGCEIGGDFVHFAQMNIFVGYWTFPFFMCAWISLAGASCCCRSRCCGITTLVFQCLAVPMALCVVGFDGYFLNNPTLCFFSSCASYGHYYESGYYNYSSGYYGSDYSNNSPLYGTKVPLVRGQLAAGVLMFVSNVVLIIIFGITCYRVRNTTMPPNGQQMIPGGFFSPESFVPSHGDRNPVAGSSVPLQTLYIAPPISPVIPSNHVVCPNCRTNFQVATARNDDPNRRHDLVLD